MMHIDSKNHVIKLDKTPGRIKKITGTRFAAILGLNHWTSPFEAWCDMTKTYKIPFEDTKYTLAGKIIEPKVIAYLDKTYHFGKGICKGPDDWFGKTKEELHYDHFPENKTFGGMWDCRTKDIVYELKTTKRVEDWYKDGKLDAPIYYKLQGALYAWLLGLDKFRMVLTVLEDSDYERPEAFIPDSKNTHILQYSLKQDIPQFDGYITACEQWLHDHIKNPVSPRWDEFDTPDDKDIMKALTTAHAAPQNTLDGADPVQVLLQQIEPLQAEVDAVAEKEAQLKDLKDQLKPLLTAQMKDSDKKIILPGTQYDFTVSRSCSTRVDSAALKKAGIYDQYAKTSEVIKLNVERKAI